MIRILLNGCNGKMGMAVTSTSKKYEDIEITAGISPSGEVKDKYPVYKDIFEVTEIFDVIVDFSKPESLDNILDYALKVNKPLLIGTTGHTDEQKQKINSTSENLPIFFSANVSIGINVILEVINNIVPLLKNNFDIEILEKHHNQKIDAPSGTANLFAKHVQNNLDTQYELVYDRHENQHKRNRNEIGMSSIRGGTLHGEHSIMFFGNDEIIEIKHTALSKNIFSEGIIKAVYYMIDKQSGLYTMKDVLNI